MYNPLFALCVLGKSYGFSSGSFLFANLVLNQNNVPYTNTLNETHQNHSTTKSKYVSGNGSFCNVKCHHSFV